MICDVGGINKIDARKLTKEAQQHNHDQAIQLYQQGKMCKEIAAIIGVRYVVACGWMRHILK